jgi:carotenoid cleavage dioxygenase-like enzyme
MLTIQCTKKLISELKLDIPREKSVDIEPLYSWHSHLFLFNRKKHVIVMNNLTRYNFILPELKKTDFKNFHQIVLEAISVNLLAEGASKEIVEKYILNFDTVNYINTSDRSIISQMNEMIKAAEYSLNEDKYNLIKTDFHSLNRWLNRFIMLKLPKLYSGETMLEALKKL